MVSDQFHTECIDDFAGNVNPYEALRAITPMANSLTKSVSFLRLVLERFRVFRERDRVTSWGKGWPAIRPRPPLCWRSDLGMLTRGGWRVASLPAGTPVGFIFREPSSSTKARASVSPESATEATVLWRIVLISAIATTTKSSPCHGALSIWAGSVKSGHAEHLLSFENWVNEGGISLCPGDDDLEGCLFHLGKKHLPEHKSRLES